LKKLRKVAEVIGTFGFLFGILFLVFYFTGVSDPFGLMLSMLGYGAVGCLIFLLVGAGFLVGTGLWESPVTWKKFIGGVLLVISSTIGISLLLYIYSSVDMSDCPTGTPSRYC
jgi:hypothetical protein